MYVAPESKVMVALAAVVATSTDVTNAPSGEKTLPEQELPEE